MFSEPTLSASDRVDLGIKIVLALHALHTGENSQTGTKYAHGDMFPANITIDAQKNIFLIDYGQSIQIKSDSGAESDDYVKHDIRTFMQRVVFPTDNNRELFTREMKKYWPFPDDDYNAATSILDAVQKLESFKLIAHGISDEISAFSNENRPIKIIEQWGINGQLKEIIKNANNLAAFLAISKANEYQTVNMQKAFLSALDHDFIYSLMQEQSHLMYETIFASLAPECLDKFKSFIPPVPAEKKPDSVIFIEKALHFSLTDEPQDVTSPRV